MKRFAWLLVLPWSLVKTTGTFVDSKGNNPDPGNYQVRYDGVPWVFNCAGKAKDSCQDFVDVMNQAHARRLATNKKTRFNPDDMVEPDREVIPPCLGATCGEDDFVGKKP